MSDDSTRKRGNNSFSPEKGSSKKAKRKTRVMEMAIIKVNGGGMRVLSSHWDYHEPASIRDTILNVRNNSKSQMNNRFIGYSHTKPIEFNGKTYDKVSYRWKGYDDDNTGNATPEALATLFESTYQFKLDPNLPYGPGNQKATVEILADEAVPMNMVYCDKDIVEHCVGCHPKYNKWRTMYGYKSQEEGFWWQDPATHSTLEDTITALKAQEFTSPTVQGLTF
jgi:hypothetical protein